MGQISKLKNVDANLIAKLQAKNVTTVEDLWVLIGPKFEKGIKDFQGTDCSREELVEILIQGACPPTPKSNYRGDRFTFWMSNHWAEVIAMIIAMFISALLALNMGMKQDTVLISTKSGLPAFHVLTPEDVRTERMFKTSGSLTSVEKAEGRYLLRPVSEGAVLLDNQLGPPELKNELTGRFILTIPMKAGAIRSAIAPNLRVRLLFSPRDLTSRGTSSSVEDVIVLAIDRQGDTSSITVAVRNQDDLIKATNLSATSDILISE